MAKKMTVGKKGSKSKTHKGRKNFTTKKSSKYHVIGGYEDVGADEGGPRPAAPMAPPNEEGNDGGSSSRLCRREKRR